MSLPVSNLTIQNEEKDRLKIQRKRDDLEKRRQRILNPRTRVIGLDTVALDAQCAAKAQGRDDQREADRLEFLRTEEIGRVLAAAEEQEKDMRRYDQANVRKSWEDSIAFRSETRAKEAAESDTDYSKAGLASALNFAGCDPDRMNRLSKQKQQMRKWTAEQVNEKEFRKSLEREEDAGYFDLLKRIDETREQSERDQAAYSRGIRMKFANENTLVMRAQKDRLAQEKMDNRGVTMGNLSIVVEDLDLAMDANGRIIRKDMYKGLTIAQQKKLLAFNDAELDQKRVAQEQERDMERQWAIQSEVQRRLREQANQDETDIRESKKAALYASLRNQSDAAAISRREWESARFGSIGEGFFNAFGTSGR